MDSEILFLRPFQKKADNCTDEIMASIL